MMSIVRQILPRSSGLLLASCLAFASIPSQGQNPNAQGVWLAVAASPGLSPLDAAKVTINGKAAGQTSSKGLVFIPKERIFHHSVAVAIAKAGYQTSRRQLMLSARPKTVTKPAYTFVLAAIPARLGPSAPTHSPLAGPFPPKQPGELSLSTLKSTAAMATIAAVETKAPRYRLADLPLRDKKPLVAIPRLKVRADSKQPQLWIELVEKPQKPARRAKSKKKTTSKTTSSTNQGQPKLSYRGAIGRLVYAKPKGHVGYCDLSSGRCAFPLSHQGAGLRPKQLTISGEGFKTRTITIRSPKSQTVKVTVSRIELAERTPDQKRPSAFAASYNALLALGTPSLHAADGELSAEEQTNLLKYGSTIKPIKPKKRSKKAKKKTPPATSDTPSLGWRDIKVVSPGYVAIPGGNLSERAFASKTYQPPKVTLVTLGGPKATGKPWLDEATRAALNGRWQNKTQLNWLPEHQLKALLAKNGRSLSAWLASHQPNPAVDFVVILTAVQGKPGSYLAALKRPHSQNPFLAAKLYDSSTGIEKAIETMLRHIPYEVTAIASKDGDVAINMPKSLYSELATPSPKFSPQQGLAPLSLRLLDGQGQEQPLTLTATKSYPRLTYFSPLSQLQVDGAAKAGNDEKSAPTTTRIRIGQRFIIGLTEHRVSVGYDATNPEQRAQLVTAKGGALAQGLVWTNDERFLQTNERGYISGNAAVTGFFHPDFGAYQSPASLRKTGGKRGQIFSVTAQKLIQMTTSPVPAEVTIEGKNLGQSPLALYHRDAVTPSSTKPVAVTLSPSNSKSGANAYETMTAKVKPTRLVAKQHWAISLSPDHLTRSQALISAGKLKEAERYLKTLPRRTRTSFEFRFVKATILAKQGHHQACHSAFQKLTQVAARQKSADRIAASALNESVCLSQSLAKKPSLKNLRRTLASLKKAEQSSKADKTAKHHLPSIAFYGSHLKYLYWRATGKKSFLADAVRGYRYYLTMTAPQNAGDERLASFKIEAKKVIAMAEQ